MSSNVSSWQSLQNVNIAGSFNSNFQYSKWITSPKIRVNSIQISKLPLSFQQHIKQQVLLVHQALKGYWTTAQMMRAMKLQTPPKKGRIDKPTIAEWAGSWQSMGCWDGERENFLIRQNQQKNEELSKRVDFLQYLKVEHLHWFVLPANNVAVIGHRRRPVRISDALEGSHG